MPKPKNETEYLVVTLPWIIIIFGILGNALSAAVVLRKKFRYRSMGAYLLALAILDSIFLLSNTLLAWGIEILFQTKIQALHPFGCSFVKYIIVASRAMSAWVLVILSVERLLALAIPHLSASINTRRRAIISIVVVVIYNGLVYLYNFFTANINRWGNCYWTEHVYNNNYHVILNIFDLLNYSVIPSVIMAISNCVLIHLLCYSNELRTRTGNDDTKSIIITVLLMSMAFILLTTPMTIYQILFVARIDVGKPYGYVIVYALDLLNHAVNFLLYCLSGSPFRYELKTMLRSINCFRKGPVEGTDMTSVELSRSSKENTETIPKFAPNVYTTQDALPENNNDNTFIKQGALPENINGNAIQSEEHVYTYINQGALPENINGNAIQPEDHVYTYINQGALSENINGNALQPEEHGYTTFDEYGTSANTAQNSNTIVKNTGQDYIEEEDSSYTHPKEVYTIPIAVEHWLVEV